MNESGVDSTINLPSGTFVVHYSITLGDVLVSGLLLCILVVLILRWVYDTVF